MGSVSRHEHRQISNGYHDAPEEVACYACNKQIFKGCSSSVYSCTEGCGTFSLHKTCAELPPTFRHQTHQHHILKLEHRPRYYTWNFGCQVCKVRWKWSIYHCSECRRGPYYVCRMCVILELQSSEDRDFHHPGHDKHPLTLVQRPGWFECDACGTGAFDLSYVCTKCPFWMHQSCAFAPTTLEYKFHDNHPLILAYSLSEGSEQSINFAKYCIICSEQLNILHWLYYCSDCSFFAHITCVTSTQFMEEPPPTLRKNENDEVDLGMTNFVKLPPPDKSSVDLIMQQFVRAISLTDDNTTAPDHINHWAHNDHPLKLFDQQIEKTNTTEWFGANDDEMLQCDGCGRPISSGDLFYGCVICNYFLHKFCAQIPREIQPQIYPGHKFVGHQNTKPYELVSCVGCGLFFNGIHFNCEREGLCIGCVSLPSMIKHEAHKHPLIGKLYGYKLKPDGPEPCRACGDLVWSETQYICEVCKICLHAKCAIRPGTVRHRWDPHPLHLIYAPVMVKNHPHDFDCEKCSRYIDTNKWFYHCAVCDLSFHPHCFDAFDAVGAFFEYSYVKFGANNIKDENLHQHNLTFALTKNRKQQRLCSRCKHRLLSGSVLECAPCSFELCLSCIEWVGKRVSL